jgi:F-type H+-transporting ATPase subunit b
MISKINSVKKTVCTKTFLRVGLLVLLAGSFAAPRIAGAQEQTPAPQQQTQSDDSKKQPGLGQRLTRETREAAGEDKEDKDDKAQFKQSASVHFVAKKLGISVETASFLAFFFNFAVIAGIILWAARKSLPGAFRNRTAAIQKAMQEAQKASEEARRRLAEIESRLMKLDVEIGMMRDAAEKEATAEEARIQAAAREDARKIVEAARQEIAAAAKSARHALTAYAADLAVGLAQKQIRVDAATDEALVREFATQLTTSSAGVGDAPRKDRQ